MKTKSCLLGVVLSALTFSAITGCESDEPVVPQAPDMFYPADSILLYDVFKAAYEVDDEFLNGTLLIDCVDKLTDAQPNPLFYISTTVSYDENHQLRVTRLQLVSSPMRRSTLEIPESIRNLEYLSDLTVSGDNWGSGPMPDYVAELKNLTSLKIIGTKYTALPDDIFNENMTRVDIEGADYLTSLPSSITRLNSMKDPSRLFRVVGNNSLGGMCPPITQASIQFQGNKFTSFDWSTVAKRYIAPDDGKVYYVGAWLEHNYINEPIPDYILNDTVAIWHFRQQLGAQQLNGFPQNLPSEDELMKMRKEYIQNHPEDVLFAAEARSRR